MSRTLSNLHAFIHNGIVQERFHLGTQGVDAMLDFGRKWNLAATVSSGGAVLFPHTYLEKCGHQVASAVHACLDSGADQILAIGVLHALSQEMIDAKVQEEQGEDVSNSPYFGIQGPELNGRQEWRNEFSLLQFEYLLHREVKRRGIVSPKLIFRYPFLVSGKAEALPGIKELESIAKDSAVVATGDLFHHGIGYGESPLTALPSEAGGCELARRSIIEGFELLSQNAYPEFRKHCIQTKSDASDVLQVLRYLVGPLTGNLLDMITCDTSLMWDSLPPTWVAAALVEFNPHTSSIA